LVADVPTASSYHLAAAAATASAPDGAKMHLFGRLANENARGK
jgi:hypothetical protein